MSLAAATLRSMRDRYAAIATLMALQAGLPPLDFSGVKGAQRERYFQAVHAAVAGNLAPMMFVFERIIARTQRGRRS